MGSISKWDAISLEEFRNIRDELIIEEQIRDHPDPDEFVRKIRRDKPLSDFIGLGSITTHSLEAIAIIVNRKVRQ